MHPSSSNIDLYLYYYPNLLKTHIEMQKSHCSGTGGENWLWSCTGRNAVTQALGGTEIHLLSSHSVLLWLNAIILLIRLEK